MPHSRISLSSREVSRHGSRPMLQDRLHLMHIMEEKTAPFTYSGYTVEKDAYKVKDTSGENENVENGMHVSVLFPECI